MAAPAYFYQRRLDGLFAIYDERGPVKGYEQIETAGDAQSHILDLIEADRLEAEQEAAQLAADHAEADAHAYSLPASVGRAA